MDINLGIFVPRICLFPFINFVMGKMNWSITNKYHISSCYADAR